MDTSSRLLRSYQVLFWHLFGVTPMGQYRLTTKDGTGNLTELKSGRVTMTVGEILLMIYHAMAIIVLVNMLIAMMSNSFQMIQVRIYLSEYSYNMPLLIYYNLQNVIPRKSCQCSPLQIIQLNMVRVSMLCLTRHSNLTQMT